MSRQNDPLAYYYLMDNFDALCWKYSHHYYNLYKPEGIDVEDLYQEAKLGVDEALLTYQDSKRVGLAHYVKICAISFIKTLNRKCYGKSYRLIDSSFSLDLSVSEDDSLKLMDLIAIDNTGNDPRYQALLEEARGIFDTILSDFSKTEKKTYEMWSSGYTYKEIAGFLQINTKQVDNIIQKVKRLANNA